MNLSELTGPVWMVDDESALVTATVGMLNREIKDRVRGSNDSREVARWIETERPAALITDVRMPHVSGLELVTRLHQKWGAVPVVVMTAYPTAQVDEEVRAGTFVYLAKPFSFQALREALMKVCARPPPPTFSGAIAVSMLSEVVQLYSLSNRTGTLRVTSPDGVGDIAFEAGRVVHAQIDALTGVDAFNAILGWDSGQFSWQSTRAATETIGQSVSELLLEAYRLRDERSAARTTSPSADPAIDATTDAVFAEFETPSAAPTSGPGNVSHHLSRLERADGFLSAALFDLESSACLASVDHGAGRVGVAIAAEAHVDMLRANRQTVDRLELDDAVEDVVISLQREYHLVRLVRRRPSLFFFLTLDRQHANLAMARYLLSEVESDIVLS